MARHIFIGDATAVSYAAGGTLAAGALDVQKLSTSGPTSMVAGDTRTNTEQFRIVQGDGTRDIVSPWLYGKDIINWDGQTYAAPLPHLHTITYTGTSTAAGPVTIKIVRTDQPGFEAFSFDTAIPSGTAAAAVGPLVTTAYGLATVPDWLNVASANGGATSTITGSIAGGATESGVIWDENPPTFVVSCTNTPAGIVTTWTTTPTAPATQAGAGNGYIIRGIEERLRGNQYGYYNRVQLPIAPAVTAVVGTNYDVYSIAATKDGSSSSQIHGVDNIMEISIAITDGSGAAAIEPLLNPYMNDCGFASVVI